MKINIGPYPKGEKKRKIEVKIDSYDMWSLDHTLALIILPCLKHFEKVNGGTPWVDNADVPKEIRDKENEHCDKKWKYVLEEMIWAFEQIVNEDDSDLLEEEYKKMDIRRRNGLILFGKYLRGLWT